MKAFFLLPLSSAGKKTPSNVKGRQDRKANTRMGLFHCLSMVVGMLPFGFCVTEMRFSVSGFFQCFSSAPQWPQSVFAAVWDGNLRAGAVPPRRAS